MGDLSESTKIVWYIYLVILHTFLLIFSKLHRKLCFEYIDFKKNNVYSKLKITNNMLPDVLLIYKNPVEEMNRLHEPIIQL